MVRREGNDPSEVINHLIYSQGPLLKGITPHKTFISAEELTSQTLTLLYAQEAF